MALGEDLEGLERQAAKKRHDEQAKANLGLADGGNLPPSEKGKTRDKVGAAVGMSGKTYEKAKAVLAVVENANGC